MKRGNTTKDKVLLLLKNREDYMSGEEMSQEIGVSRAAVHTAVKKLRMDGYKIASVTNRGYRLENSVDQLSIGEIASYLEAGRENDILCYDVIDSTNTKVKELAQQGAKEGTVVIANAQTAGRGRLGRNFQSDSDNGIYMSMLLRPKCEIAQISEITAWVAVCVARAITRVCGKQTGIKWVNDVIMNGKKISGILTEMAVESESGFIQYVVVGIGINVHNQKEDFAEEIREIASSVDAESGVRVNRAKLAAYVIGELDTMYAHWPNEKDEYLQYYRGHCVNLGKEVKVIRGREERKGRAEDVTEDFQLKVIYEDGTEEKISSGEVSVRGLYGYVD